FAVGIDLGLPTGVLATLSAKDAAQNAYMVSCLLAEHGFVSAEGMVVLEEALKFAADTGARYQYPELLRTKGELLLQIDRTDRSAEDWLRTSLTAAREEGTKMLELRAAASLARQYLENGENTQARDVLEPV